jgi:hypothetical protein
MAETGNTLIVSALQEILVQASEAPIEADEAQDAIRYLNRMMAKLAVQGINLGYTVISNLGDAITVADGAIDGMVANLALALKPQFGAPGSPVDPLLVERARDGIATMRMLSIDSIGPGLFPSTLPIGSGNEDNQSFGVDHFYNESDDPLLNEQGGFISVETDTELP